MGYTITESAVQRAFKCFQEKKLAKAEKILGRELKKAPNDPDVLHLLGLINSERGDTLKALRLLKQAVSADEGKLHIKSNYATVLRQAGYVEESIGILKEVVRARPDSPQIINNLANALRLVGKLEEAIEYYRRALALLPTSAEIVNNLGSALKDLGDYKGALTCLNSALNIDPNNADIYNNLGVVCRCLNDSSHATSAFQAAVRIDPGFVLAQNNLGCALMAGGDRDGAINAFKNVLAVEPDNAEATHLLKALTQGSSDRAPDQYVADLFDEYAPTFEDSLVQKLEYKTPGKIREAVDAVMPQEGMFGNVLDLGCGTGLCGFEFKGISKKLFGVDLSPKMVEEASSKEVYDELHVGPIESYLEKCRVRFDLFIAADVFVYIGKLDQVFKAIAMTANDDALVVFSTELLGGAGIYKLLKTGRFAHSLPYVNSLAEENGFEAVSKFKTPLRKENNKWIEGMIYIFRLK